MLQTHNADLREELTAATQQHSADVIQYDAMKQALVRADSNNDTLQAAREALERDLRSAQVSNLPHLRMV